MPHMSTMFDVDSCSCFLLEHRHTLTYVCVCVCLCARKLNKYARNCLKQPVCIGRRSANSFSV